MKILGKLLFAVILSAGLANATPYKLDNSHTEVGFSVKHMMISNVKGKFKDYSAVIDFDASTNSFKTFEATVQTSSIDTANEKRDNHLKAEDFFYAEKYPVITFKMKSYEADGDEGVMVGDLTIRGITKEVKLEVDDLAKGKGFKGENRIGFSLEGKINRTDFGLKWNKALEMGGVAVSQEVKIDIEVEAGE